MAATQQSGSGTKTTRTAKDPAGKLLSTQVKTRQEETEAVVRHSSWKARKAAVKARVARLRPSDFTDIRGQFVWERDPVGAL